MARTAAAIGNVAGARACLVGDFADADAARAGVQPTCRATGQTTKLALPTCATATAGAACFNVEPDADCAALGTGLRVTFDGLATPRPEAYAVECLAP